MAYSTIDNNILDCDMFGAGSALDSTVNFVVCCCRERTKV